MIRSLVASGLLVAIGACYHGPSAETFEPAQWPEGITVDLRLSKGRVRGELLEVQDTALIVLRQNRVVLVPTVSIRHGLFQQRGLLIENGRISERERTRMRLLSRFPAGLTPELRSRLLAAYGQTDFQPAGVAPTQPPPPGDWRPSPRARARGRSDSVIPSGREPRGTGPSVPTFPGWAATGSIPRSSCATRSTRPNRPCSSTPRSWAS